MGVHGSCLPLNVLCRSTRRSLRTATLATPGGEGQGVHGAGLVGHSSEQFGVVRQDLLKAGKIIGRPGDRQVVISCRSVSSPYRTCSSRRCK